jgi:oligopeptide/dipeptide ABC transporter ATP-binding protein
MVALLEAQHLTKVFGGGMFSTSHTVALRDFSLSVDPSLPSIISVVGESGSGKSTMARLLLGLETPTTGQVSYKGKALGNLTRAEKYQFRRDIQIVFQDPFGAYNPIYKIDHVLEVPIAKFGLAKTHAEEQALIENVLEAVGLRPQDTLGRYPHQLSGGQRQRIMVARALLLHPKLIIADEPVSMIDASLRASVLDALRQLNQQFGISLIYITHDLTTAYQIGHHIIVLYSGDVVEAGGIETVVKQPQHPYTQLLIDSIPLPDPARQWQDEAPASEVGQQAKTAGGCRFASRCPHAFDRCLQAVPPLYRIHEDQAAACYLYQEQDVLPSEEMDQVFARKTLVPGEHSMEDGIVS